MVITEKHSLLLTGAAVLLLGSAMAQLTWTVLADSSSPILPISTPISDNTSAQAKRTHSLLDIAHLPLFGKAAAAPKTTAVVDAPDTSLNLKLTGIFHSSDTGISHAIIVPGSGQEEVYEEGDSIGAASIHRVHADRVILERGGRFETLRLPKESSSGVVVSLRQTDSVQRVGRVSAAATQELLQLQQELESNPLQLARKLGIMPASDSDGTSGYRLRRLSPTLANQYNIGRNDIVTHVAGIPVSDMGALMQKRNELQSMPSIPITLQRNGVSRTVTITTR